MRKTLSLLLLIAMLGARTATAQIEQSNQAHTSSIEAQGCFFNAGIHILNDRFKEGIKMLTVAANMGHPSAYTTLGGYYIRGFIVEKNAKKALEHFQEAAKLGDKVGQHHMGLCFYFGTGTPKNDHESIYYFK